MSYGGKIPRLLESGANPFFIRTSRRLQGPLIPAVHNLIFMQSFNKIADAFDKKMKKNRKKLLLPDEDTRSYWRCDQCPQQCELKIHGVPVLCPKGNNARWF